MSETSPKTVGAVGDDVVLPFTVDGLDVRGRSVHLGPMLDQMFARHNYPGPVCTLLGEMIALTVLLGTSLKFDGKFIAQTQTDGPVSLMVVDFTTPDSVRAYARFDEERVQTLVASGEASVPTLMGTGALGLTVDQGSDMQRYQGIVALVGKSLEEVAKQYFKQSEQIPTEIRLAAAEVLTRSKGGDGLKRNWRAGGVLTQFLPEAPERVKPTDLPGGGPENEAQDELQEDDAWTEAKLLTGTIRDDELTDPQIGAEQLLYRLFHEHGARVFAGMPVRDNCSCSRDKVVEMIQGLRERDSIDANEDGEYETTCEFCSKHYKVTESDFAR